MKVYPSRLAACIFSFMLSIPLCVHGNEIFHPIPLPGASYEVDLSDIFRNSFDMFQLLRNDKGIYRDAARFDGNHFHPASVAVIGMGLISLCIADEMDWIPNAEELWTSIDWSQSIADPETGEIYREFNEDGTGIPGRTTKPFNEYMIVAWLPCRRI